GQQRAGQDAGLISTLPAGVARAAQRGSPQRQLGRLGGERSAAPRRSARPAGRGAGAPGPPPAPPGPAARLAHFDSCSPMLVSSPAAFTTFSQRSGTWPLPNFAPSSAPATAPLTSAS